MYIITSCPQTLILTRPGLEIPVIPNIPIDVYVVSADLLVALEVGATTVDSPARVLELDIHSSSESGPSEDLLPPVPVAPMVSPFLCSDDSKLDLESEPVDELPTELPERHVSLEPHDAMVPIVPILPAPPTIVVPSTNIISPIIAPPGVLTARKRVEPLPSHHLALRYTSHHSSSDSSTLDFTSDSTSSDHLSSDHASSDRSLADHSLPGHYTSDQSLSGEAYLHWRSVLLSTMYPSNTFGESSSKSSVRPSRKRCRSLAATSPLPISSLGALFPTRADLLPPRKSMDVEAEVDAGIGMEVDVEVIREDEEEYEAESSARDTVRIRMDRVIKPELYDHMAEIPDDGIMDIEVGHRQLEAGSLITGGERAGLLSCVTALERSNTRLRDTLSIERVRTNKFWAFSDAWATWRMSSDRSVGLATMIGWSLGDWRHLL
ncbi:hypothetical protein Tco_0721146 [Tanacetum coccineum]